MSFNPKALLSTVITEANSTDAFQLEPGQYPATIDKVSFSPLWKEGNGVHLQINWDVETSLPEGLDRAIVVQRLPVELLDGQVDMRKFHNRRLADFREIWGLNGSGKNFTFEDFLGRAGRITVEPRSYTDKNGQAVESIDVVAVEAL